MFDLLKKNERIKFSIILLLSIITGLVQSVSVASFMPFINMLLNIDVIKENEILSFLYEFGRFRNDNQFIIFTGILIAILILFSNSMAIVTGWVKNKFILFTAHNFSKRLLRKYLSQNYEFILNRNTSELSKNILNDVFELTNGYLNGFMDMIINIIMIIFVISLLMIVNVQVTLFILGFFVFVYGSLIFFSKSKLKSTGERAILANMAKYKYANEALNGFKISKTLGIEDFLTERFSVASKKHAKYRLFAKTIQEVPKYIIDALIFSGLATAIVIFIIQGRNVDNIIPVISVYTIAGYRIMPELAKVFTAYSNIAHNRPVVESLYHELYDIDEIEKSNPTGIDTIHFGESIHVNNVSFNYQDAENTLVDINIDIAYGQVIGFAGTTGAGKTTLIDIFLGLLIPQAGNIKIDGTELKTNNLAQWRSFIGYVPQDIFLIDDTIRANIAFGIPPENIDDEQIKRVAKISAISDFIENELPQAYFSQIGERGVRLSGGQRQRIGLARALYRNPQVLVLDEATSALDGATEASVVKGIHNDSQVKTILIIAHRLNTLKSCDRIYLLEKGRIIDSGTYNYLLTNNSEFKMMAKIEE